MGYCLTSHPSRVRGLKHKPFHLPQSTISVAPLAGAWIETVLTIFIFLRRSVAPLAGAWIETSTYNYAYSVNIVAPLAGAWIETA